MFCPNCGSQLEDTDLFCERCGTPVGETPVSASKKKKSKKKLPVAIIVCAAVLVIAGIVFFGISTWSQRTYPVVKTAQIIEDDTVTICHYDSKGYITSITKDYSDGSTVVATIEWNFDSEGIPESIVMTADGTTKEFVLDVEKRKNGGRTVVDCPEETPYLLLVAFKRQMPVDLYCVRFIYNLHEFLLDGLSCKEILVESDYGTTMEEKDKNDLGFLDYEYHYGEQYSDYEYDGYLPLAYKKK